jgi:hypothetical protein
MLTVPRIGGAAQLRLFVHKMGFERACKATMRRWLARLAWRAPASWAAANEPAYHAPGLVVPLQLA